jgi:uncharacterized protein (DUF2147 family)
MRLNGILSLAIAVACHASAAGAADALVTTGPWLTEEGSAVVKIAECGPALCGAVIWSEKPVDAKGRPLCGLAVLGAAVKTGDDSWSKGWIYSPEADGKFPVNLKLASDGRLQLHVSAGLFGKDQTWTRPLQTVTPCAP